MDAKGKRGLRPIDAPDEATAPTGLPAGFAAGSAAGAVAAEIAAPEVTAPEQATAAEPASIERDVLMARAQATAAEPASIEGDVLTALARSQAALAHGLEALGNELAGLARSEIDAAARRATEMLGVRTLVDAIEIDAGFARSRFDSWVETSSRLCELGLKLAAEASQPFLTQLGRGWGSPSRFAS